MDDGCFKATPARDARRQAILHIARDVFLEEGFAAASMSTIAARLGGSKGTLYNYFPSKQELFSAVIQDECDRRHAGMYEGLSLERDGLAKMLGEVGLRYVDHVLDERTVLFSRMVIAEAIRFPELGQALYKAGPLRGRERMAMLLTEAMQQGQLRPSDPYRIADQFCELCIAGHYKRRLMNIGAKPSDAEMVANVEGALRVILSVYGTDVAPSPSGPVGLRAASAG